jgi:hypothetical protein
MARGARPRPSSLADIARQFADDIPQRLSGVLTIDEALGHLARDGVEIQAMRGVKERGGRFVCRVEDLKDGVHRFEMRFSFRAAACGQAAVLLLSA